MKIHVNIVIHRIFNVAWCRGKVPTDYRRQFSVKYLKKGDRTECKNYRGIALLSHVGKIYERVLEKRLRLVIEENPQTPERNNRFHLHPKNDHRKGLGIGPIYLIFTCICWPQKSICQTSEK